MGDVPGSGIVGGQPAPGEDAARRKRESAPDAYLSRRCSHRVIYTVFMRSLGTSTDGDGGTDL
jgi:hypothetical protein